MGANVADSTRVVEGIIADGQGNLIIDLTRPRSFPVKGLDEAGQWKDYLLRVSASGKLSLV